MSDLVQPELVQRLERLSDELITEFGPNILIRNCSVAMLEASQAIQQVLDEEKEDSNTPFSMPKMQDL